MDIGSNPSSSKVKTFYAGAANITFDTTLMINVAGGAGSNKFVVLSMIEEPCSSSTPIVFDVNSTVIGTFTQEVLVTGIYCITMSVTPTVSGAGWQLGIDDRFVPEGGTEIQNVGLHELCL